jgi:hypothetical protein
VEDVTEFDGVGDELGADDEGIVGNAENIPVR